MLSTTKIKVCVHQSFVMWIMILYKKIKSGRLLGNGNSRVKSIDNQVVWLTSEDVREVNE